MQNLAITQKTPIRVLHRRTLSDRVRTIYKVCAEKVDPSQLVEAYRPFSDRLFKLNLIAEAGTYIKEFVHSDFGRTDPSLGKLLGEDCSCDILTLDVLVSPDTNHYYYCMINDNDASLLP